MNQSKKSILSLSKIFKFDINQFVNNELNHVNLFEYFPIINELLSQQKGTNEVQRISETCHDKILELCLKSLFVETDSEHQNEVLLKYFMLCSSNCSSKSFIHLYKVFLFYFINMAKVKDLLHLKIDVSSNLFDSVVPSLISLSEFSNEKISFLDSYFTLISKSKHFSDMSTTNLALIEFLVNLSLDILYEIYEYPVICKICINNLSNIARSSEVCKQMVLHKSFTKLKDASSKEKSKKRLESFIEDSNLNLLTSLAEFLMPSCDSISLELEYLRLTEYWDLIQKGLIHTNSLTRKRALYLLKRTTDMAAHKLDLKSNHFDVFNENQNNVYLYDADSLLWNDFFLCIELMEETSVCN